MKKIIALVMVLAMIACLFAGCKGDSKGSEYDLNIEHKIDTALQELAKTYTEKTGVEVKIVTAASGDYNKTLTSNIGDVTIFNIGNTAALNDWGDYALDLKDSAIAKEQNTDSFNLYHDKGELKALGNCYESFGLIVNTKLLAEAGYSVSALTNSHSLFPVPRTSPPVPRTSASRHSPPPVWTAPPLGASPATLQRCPCTMKALPATFPPSPVST